MKALSDWNASVDPHFKDRCVVAFDLDDTLTTHGTLAPATFAAMDAARLRGWVVLIVTGRSAGWVDALIKLLPVDGVVGENGALLSFWAAGKAGRKPREEPRKLFWTPKGYASAPPEGMAARRDDAAARLLREFPRARVASDQPYRLYDLAIDFAEEVDPPLGLDVAEAIKSSFEALGAVAKVSSIHVNGWWGAFSKVEGLRELMEVIWGLSIDTNLIYAGDSPNDAPLFEAAGMSVGVANLKPFLDRDPSLRRPSYLAAAAEGAGSVELLGKLQKRDAPKLKNPL
jgi:HAD superfamily hydrolase (TIGR01484 family)